MISVVTLGERIASLRERRGMTQYALANKAGFHQSQLQKIEKGITKDPGFSTILAIAEALGVGLDALASDSGVAKVVELQPSSLNTEERKELEHLRRIYSRLSNDMAAMEKRRSTPPSSAQGAKKSSR